VVTVVVYVPHVLPLFYIFTTISSVSLGRGEFGCDEPQTQ